jgi:hypothetical protein
VILGLIRLLFDASGCWPELRRAWSRSVLTVCLARLRCATRGMRAPVRVMLVVGALFLLPFAVGGLALLGLADIWLDFRRRMAPPTSGGLDR